MRNQKGFTLIELIAVIVLLGILAAVAIPKFIDLKKDAEIAKANGVYAAAQSVAALNFAARLVGHDPLPDIVHDGMGLLQRMACPPSGWEANGVTLQTTPGTTSMTYIITVEHLETPTAKAVLSKNW